MAAYIARRLIWVVFLLFVITLITFIIFSVLPAGDPAVARAGRQPSPELIAAIRQQLGLDKPKPVQFINYIGDILPFLGGNGIYFGFSYKNNTDVLPEILERLPATLFLTAGAVILWLSIGIPVGVLSAVKTGSWMDRAGDGHRADLHLGPGLLPRPRRALPVRRRHREVPDPAGQLGLRRRRRLRSGRRRR